MEEVRQQLKMDGYKAGRISQLIEATRPSEEDRLLPSAVAAALKKPAASRPAAPPEAGACCKHIESKEISLRLNCSLHLIVLNRFYIHLLFSCRSKPQADASDGSEDSDEEAHGGRRRQHRRRIQQQR